MGTYSGNNGNNTFTAHTEWQWLPPGYVWKSWKMYGKGGSDSLTGGPKNDTLYGDEGDDTLNGRRGDDYLYGGSENDVLIGESGRDVLYGGSDRDYLDGGSGSDSMYGGTGGDVYIVDSSTDLVKEYFDEGIDFVKSSVSFSLGDNIEHLFLENNGSSINGYGNNLDNLMYGNTAANYLSSYDGNDTLAGWGGNDILVGGEGSDWLLGGEGADIFVFYSPLEGIDTIADFQWQQEDKIQVSAAGFGIGSGDYSKFSFDSNTGSLFFDGIQFASLQLGSEFIPDLDIVIV